MSVTENCWIRLMTSNVFILFFFLFFILTILLVLLRVSSKNQLPFYLLFWVFLILFAGFNTASPDYDGYKHIAEQVGSFEDFADGSTKNLHGDITFYLISSFVNTFELDIQFVFIIMAFISISITSFVVFKLSNNPFVSLILYGSHHYLNKDVIQIRAGLSSSLLLLTVLLISYRHKIFASYSYFFSVMSHSSSLIALPPIMATMLISRQQLSRLLVAVIIVGFVIHVLGGFFGLLKYIEIFLPQGVKNYIDWQLYNYDMGLFNLSSIRALFISSALIFFLNRVEQSRSDVIFISCYIMGTFLLIAFSDFAILAGRLSSILMSAEIILLVNLASKLKKIKFLLLVVFYALLVFLNNVLFSPFNLGEFSFDLIS